MHLNHFLSVKSIFVSGLSPNRESLNLLISKLSEAQTHCSPVWEEGNSASSTFCFLGITCSLGHLKPRWREKAPPFNFYVPVLLLDKSVSVTIWQTMGPACLWCCLCICVWVHMTVWIPEVNARSLPQSLSPLVFETGSFTKTRAQWLTRLAG